MFGEDTMDRSQTLEWFPEFKHEQLSVEENQHYGQHLTRTYEHGEKLIKPSTMTISIQLMMYAIQLPWHKIHANAF